MIEWVDQFPYALETLSVVVVILASYLAHKLVGRVVIRSIDRFVKRTEGNWDDALHRNKVFERLAYLAPAIVVYYGIQFVPGIDSALQLLVQRLTTAVMVAAALLSVSAFLTAANDVYSGYEVSRSRPIKGYLQILKIVLWAIGTIVVIALLVDQSPFLFLSGLGALTAVLMLIFKDTILSLVASIQITSDDMVRVGDWIEMPKLGADGDVVDIALHTVKVQNWDKTITTIPTYKLIEDSFKNWRSMPASGGRRIKRSINIDMHSVRFLTDADIEQFSQFELLREYMAVKRDELEQSNREKPSDLSANYRRLTNLGTFRAYVISYLRNHPKINQNMTFLVRQLTPTAQGIPIEIYVFSSETEWVAYEDVQADIFDHLIAMADEFGLAVFQQPSGRDFRKLWAKVTGS
ncbi:MAG: mechanosensitive ion channel family protein [Gemmatimonadales bacterium]